MKCRNCGREIDEEAKFCEFCGKSTASEEKPVVEELMYCRNCGKRIRKDASFCKFCGESFKEEKVNSPQKQINTEIYTQKLSGGNFWSMELLITVILAAASIFIPYINFGVMGYEKNFSLMGVWDLLKKMGNSGIFINDDVNNLKGWIIIPFLFCGGSIIFGIKFLLHYIDDKNSVPHYTNVAKGAFYCNIATIAIIMLFLQVLNNGFDNMIGEFISYLSNSGSYFGDIKLSSVTMYGILQIGLNVFNLFYVIPKKIGTPLKYFSNDNSKKITVTKRCVRCGTRYSLGIQCPKCRCSEYEEE